MPDDVRGGQQRDGHAGRRRRDPAVLGERDQVRVDEAGRRQAADEERDAERPEAARPDHLRVGLQVAVRACARRWRRPAAACGPPIGSRPTSSGPVAQPARADRRDDAGQQQRPADQRRAPADERDQRERERDEQQLPGAEARLDERERQPAPLREPVGHRDRRRDAARAAEAQRRDQPVGDGQLPRRLRRGAEREARGDQQRGDRQRPADPEAVDRAADERLRARRRPGTTATRSR